MLTKMHLHCDVAMGRQSLVAARFIEMSANFRYCMTCHTMRVYCLISLFLPLLRFVAKYLMHGMCWTANSTEQMRQ